MGAPSFSVCSPLFPGEEAGWEGRNHPSGTTPEAATARARPPLQNLASVQKVLSLD